MGASFLASGCSVIGFGLGSAIDSAIRDTVWLGGSEILGLEYIDSTNIRMKDGTMLKGTEFRMVHLPGGLYEQKYNQAMESGNLVLPRLNDTVEVVRVRGTSAQRTLSAPFLGLGVDTHGKGGAVKLLVDSSVKSVDLSTVETVKDRHGETWEGAVLKSKLVSLPIDRAVHLNVATGDTLLAVGDIDSVRGFAESGWKWVGLGIGASVDLAAIAVLATFDMDFDLSGLSGE
jgi:hypothetical protein